MNKVGAVKPNDFVKMMVKSKTNTTAFWIAPIMAIFFIGMLSMLIFNFKSDKDSWTTLIWTLVFLAYAIPASLYLKVMAIDTNNKTITITRFFTRIQSIYKFTDFDGYGVTSINPWRGRPYKDLRLIKDEKTVQKVSGVFYSNFDEIESSLNEIGCLWVKKHRFFS